MISSGQRRCFTCDGHCVPDTHSDAVKSAFPQAPMSNELETHGRGRFVYSMARARAHIRELPHERAYVIPFPFTESRKRGKRIDASRARSTLHRSPDGRYIYSCTTPRRSQLPAEGPTTAARSEAEARASASRAWTCGALRAQKIINGKKKIYRSSGKNRCETPTGEPSSATRQIIEGDSSR